MRLDADSAPLLPCPLFLRLSWSCSGWVRRLKAWDSEIRPGVGGVADPGGLEVSASRWQVPGGWPASRGPSVHY